MVPPPGTITGHLSPGEEFLDARERGVVNQGLVVAGIDHSPVHYFPGVIGVRQQSVQRGSGQRFANGAAISGGEATSRQFNGQLRQRQLATSVLLERPRDMRCTYWIRDDRLDFTRDAVVAGDPCGGVDIPGWCIADRATALGFLSDALLGLRTEVTRIKFCHRGHDAVQQHTGWGFVDLLRDRHQLRTSLPDGQQQRDVVGTVTCQPVEFVHDDERDGRLTLIRQSSEQVL
ncbi:hypothetical protein VV02_24735 [Luteipulveratus mongoliensis]|uniref:Uncharacterized protein n=1 Tax=Luteipulveratus mongoliensis TaxID=571913 RepID=A0A0K1JNK8_9MICO|nr:hypothetical protein VV02_24735 [Luteipulveratus mongoliensis]